MEEPEMDWTRLVQFALWGSNLPSRWYAFKRPRVEPLPETDPFPTEHDPRCARARAFWAARAQAGNSTELFAAREVALKAASTTLADCQQAHSIAVCPA